jgi:HD-GYP domain-containing protein (c-di-GMP phosphodiesterase class II)
MHEHLDGSGYPLGLQGDDINIDSRVLSVANTFCALVRPRSYRQAHGVRQAITILAAKPPKYDPVIVQTLYSFLQSPDGKAFLESLTRAE